jgi:hypothetical protein
MNATTTQPSGGQNSRGLGCTQSRTAHKPNTPIASPCTTRNAQAYTAPNASGENTKIPITRDSIPRSHHQSKFLRVKTIPQKMADAKAFGNRAIGK